MENKTEYANILRIETMRGYGAWGEIPFAERISEGEKVVYMDGGEKRHGMAISDSFLIERKGLSEIVACQMISVVGTVEEREVMFT